MQINKSVSLLLPLQDVEAKGRWPVTSLHLLLVSTRKVYLLISHGPHGLSDGLSDGFPITPRFAQHSVILITSACSMTK